ncbi:MAG: SPOR domain-containing protein [Candidatus Omnitrophica bacterium]|nr:SPOR domain-containing protein [Candidatus Omnitrophota bacterium]
MNINYKEPQFELFPINSATLEDVNKPKFLLATLTLSTESLVVLVVLAIMIGLLSFSVGVEQGKRLAAQALDNKVAAAWNVGGRRLAAPNPTTDNNAFIHPALVSGVTATFAVRTAAVKTQPATTLRAVASGSKWTVLVATYRNENYAQQEALGLKLKGYPVFLIKKKDFYLVCVGPYSSQPQADASFKKVQAKYQGSQVRRF